MSEENLQISQYDKIFKILESFSELNGNDYEISKNVANNILKLENVVNICNIHNFSTDLLFDVDENKFQEFLFLYNKTLKVELNISKYNLLLNVFEFVKKKYKSDIIEMNHRDIKLVNDAYTLFSKRIIIFKYKIENLKILEEIKLERLKYEIINKKQISINNRNSYFTLIAIVLTASLTIANIIVTSLKIKG